VGKLKYTGAHEKASRNAKRGPAVIDIRHSFDSEHLLNYVPHIRKNIGDWQLVEVSLTGKTAHNIPFIARKLQDIFSARDGVLFICNARDIVLVLNMGAGTSAEKVSSSITEKLPKYSCTVDASEMTADGLLKFQVRLQDMEAPFPDAENALLETRKRRAERVIMIAEDDMFIRSLVVNLFRQKARVIELDKVAPVLDAYLEHLPDILFLDIHLPDGSGVEALSNVMNFDNSAYVIMLTSDSVRDNVIETKKRGASGFLAKPFSKGKIEECYNKCPSIAPWLNPKKT
jgi:two-component system chemotaxis response regulator CheY